MLAPVAAALALALAANASVPPTPQVRNRVRALLGAIHGPASPEAFRAIGPGAEEALLEFARDARGLPSQRVRALDALAGLGGERAEEAHRDIAASAQAPRAVRRGAVRGLGRLAGPQRAPQVLAPYLEGDRDPTVRAAAAEALAMAAPQDGCARIRAQAGAEPSPARFERALALCENPADTQATPTR